MEPTDRSVRIAPSGRMIRNWCRNVPPCAGVGDKIAISLALVGVHKLEKGLKDNVHRLRFQPINSEQLI